MRKYYYFIVEGMHDIEALGHYLKAMNLKRVQNLNDLDLYWDRLIPKKFPYQNNLLKRVPVPTFFQNEAMSIAIHPSGGEDKIPKIFNSVEHMDYNNLAGIAVFCDADQFQAEEKHSRLLTEILKVTNDDLTRVVENAPFREVKNGHIKFGVYVFPDNNRAGTLENLLLEGAEETYKALMTYAKNYIEESKSIDEPYIKKSYLDGSKGNKVLIGVMANVLEPGAANQVSIRKSQWISPSTMTEKSQGELYQFVEGILHE